jgi:hypothetical protein
MLSTAGGLIFAAEQGTGKRSPSRRQRVKAIAKLFGHPIHQALIAFR